MTIADRIHGLGVAIATPFLEGSSSSGTGGVDMQAFRRLVRHIRDGGADFLVVLGSTGEAATLSQDERDRLVMAAREERGDMPLVVGTGQHSTEGAVDLAGRAAAAGAEALLVVVPYYNKPQPAGIEAHFRAIAAAVPALPIVVYNVPGRTGLNLLPRDLARLWSIPQVVAVKESSGNLAQIGEIARTLPPGKTLLSGDDGLALPAIAVAPAVSFPYWRIFCRRRRRLSSTQPWKAAWRKRAHCTIASFRSWTLCSSRPIPRH